MSDTTYNGWTNYETWSCKLWIDNCEGEYHYFQEMAEHQAANGANAYDFGKEIESYFEEAAKQWMGDQASFFADIFNAALGSVDWTSIAESMLEDIAEDAA